MALTAPTKRIEKVALPPSMSERKMAQEEAQRIRKAFLGKGAIEPDPNRSLVSAEFDSENRLVLLFDDGQKITTNKPDFIKNIEQHVSIGVLSDSASGITGNIKFISGTYYITDDDDVLIANVDADVYLPAISSNRFVIKRYPGATVTLNADGAQRIQYSQGFVNPLILNVDGFSVVVKQDPNGDWAVI